MATIFDIPEEVLAKYEPILAKPVEDVEEEIQQLAEDYYKAVIEEDKELINSTVNEINSYVELDVPDFDNYLSYCLLTSINNLLAKLYGTDLELYVPKPVNLIFNTVHQRQAKYVIEEHNLTAEEVEKIVQYNLEGLEINSLSLLGYDKFTLKHKTQLPRHLEEEHFLLNSNYIAEHKIEAVAKFFYAMNHYHNANGDVIE